MIDTLTLLKSIKKLIQIQHEHVTPTEKKNSFAVLNRTLTPKEAPCIGIRSKTSKDNSAQTLCNRIIFAG